MDSTSMANSLIHSAIESPIKANIRPDRPKLQDGQFQNFEMNLATGPSPLIPHRNMGGKFGKKAGETQLKVSNLEDGQSSKFDMGARRQGKGNFSIMAYAMKDNDNDSNIKIGGE